MTIELTDREYELLLLALAIATVSCKTDNSIPGSFEKMLGLANAVNRNNPHWTPYDAPEMKA